MRWIVLAVALLIAAPAWAKPANTECRVSDGTRIYIVASNGNVMRVRTRSGGVPSISAAS